MKRHDAVCRKALDALDRALDDRPDRVYDDMAEAVRCLVRLRDGMIEHRRDEREDARAARQLVRVNALLSLVVGGEYPLQGVRQERIRNARDDLAQLLDDLAEVG